VKFDVANAHAADERVENVFYSVLPNQINSEWQWELVYSSQVQVFSLEDSFEPVSYITVSKKSRQFEKRQLHKGFQKDTDDVNEIGQYLNPNATMDENKCFQLPSSNETLCCTPYINTITAQLVIQSSIDESSDVKNVLQAQTDILMALANALNESFADCTVGCCPSLHASDYALIRLVGKWQCKIQC
jgi:hypothetical protein